MDLVDAVRGAGDCYQVVLSGGSVVSLMGGKINHTLHEFLTSLTYINRFTGNMGAYTVAQHSCLVSDILGGSYNALLHDAHESIVGDVSTPIKNALNLAGNNVWRDFEHGIAKSFRLHWGVTNPLPPQVKEADHMAMRIEVASLATNYAKSSYMKMGVEPLYNTKWHIQDVWSPDRSYREFMERFEKLGPLGRRK